MRTAKLDEIVRQKDPALKSAVEMLATGQVSAALDALQQQGRVQGNSRPRRARPRHRQELRRIAREHSHRLTRQCFPPRTERRRSPGVEGQWHPCPGRSHFPRPRSAPGHDRSRTLLGQPLRNRRCGPLRARQQSHRNRSRQLRVGRRDQPRRQPAHRRESQRRTRHLRSAPPNRRQRLPRDRPRVLRRRPHPVHRARQVARRRQSRPCRHRVHRIPMAASPPASTTTARSSSTPASIAISTTATPSPATAPRDSPPSASSFTPIPASTRTCSTPASATSPSPAPATRPRSSPTTWQNSPPNSEPMSRRPPPWKSIKPHPSPRGLGWGYENADPWNRQRMSMWTHTEKVSGEAGSESMGILAVRANTSWTIATEGLA